MKISEKLEECKIQTAKNTVIIKELKQDVKKIDENVEDIKKCILNDKNKKIHFLKDKIYYIVIMLILSGASAAFATAFGGQ